MNNAVCLLMIIGEIRSQSSQLGQFYGHIVWNGTRLATTCKINEYDTNFFLAYSQRSHHCLVALKRAYTLCLF